MWSLPSLLSVLFGGLLWLKVAFFAALTWACYWGYSSEIIMLFKVLQLQWFAVKLAGNRIRLQRWWLLSCQKCCTYVVQKWVTTVMSNWLTRKKSFWPNLSITTHQRKDQVSHHGTPNALRIQTFEEMNQFNFSVPWNYKSEFLFALKTSRLAAA